MMQQKITRDRVFETCKELPAFPTNVLRLLAAIDDPHANLQLVVEIVEADPMLTASVLSHAIRLSNATDRRTMVNGVSSAVFLVGLARVREIALTLSLHGFMGQFQQGEIDDYFWHHSVFVAASGLELASGAPMEISEDSALIACLLHDVGDLWLQQFEPMLMQQVRHDIEKHGIDVVEAERALLGVDHGVVGGWLAQSWGLPPAIAKAVTHHHAPNIALDEPLVAVAHVAEVLGSALSVHHLTRNRVTNISASACAKLGVDWGLDTQKLFGRIEARSYHTLRLMAPLAQ
jgi:putative nucleotidyltransferase with HDIG domain